MTARTDPHSREYSRTVARLGIEAAEALDHAHQLGIVHRDVKPGNLLVDAAGKLWVTDFGLAHVGADKSLTLTGDLVGTLRYMSPEQALAKRVPIDHRTDVYSLGVTLYELLTLQPAVRGGDRQEVLQQIAFEEPMLPRRIQKTVPAELETIVLKAMEKNPADRYITARELADDLRRFLDGQPIRARRPTITQRLLSWSRRHRAVVVAAVVVLLVAVVGLAASTVLIWREREQTRAEKERADADRRLAREALDTMTSQVIEEWLARQQELTPERRRFLQTTLSYYERFAAQTGRDEETRAGVADAHLRIGVIHYRLGEHRAAEEAYRHAQVLYAQLATDFPMQFDFRQRLARSSNNLGNLLKDAGRLPEAESAYREALAVQTQLAADFHTRPDCRGDLARSHNNLGVLLRTTGRPKEAESAYREALILQQQLAADFPSQPDFRHELAGSHHNLGVLFQRTGRLQEAEVAYREALSLKKQLAADFPTRPDFRQDLAKHHHNLGVLLTDTGRLQEAEAAYREALSLKKQLAADFPSRPDFRQDLAMSYNSLGLLLADTGRPKEAEAAYHEALTLQRQLAADFPSQPDFRHELAGSHHNLGTLLSTTDRVQEAEAAYREALTLKKQLAVDFPTRPAFRDRLARSHNNLGNLLRATGRPQEAEAAYREALTLRKQLAADFPKVPDYENALAGSLVNLAGLLRDRRDFAAARQLHVEAIPHHQAALKANPHHPGYRDSYRRNLLGLVGVLAGLQDQVAAVRTAEQLRDLDWDPAGNAYDAACALALCVPIVAQDQHLASDLRQVQVWTYADRAMDLLRQAVARGFKDVAHMHKDKDLDPLRQRDDFQKLLADLEAKQKPAPPLVR
jgi:hypothetical protein